MSCADPKRFYLYRAISPSGKAYIGLSCNPRRRWVAHRALAKRGSDTPFHRALRAYPKDSIVWEILAVGELAYIQGIGDRCDPGFRHDGAVGIQRFSRRRHRQGRGVEARRIAMTGRIWANDGVTHRQFLTESDIPVGWVRGMLKQAA